jgi:hypothetical protein
MRQVIYDPINSSKMYLERTIGIPTIRNSAELMEILNSERHIWIIATPYGIFTKLFSSDIREFIRKNGHVVYESYNSRIYLISK